jgi:hypothetical protein
VLAEINLVALHALRIAATFFLLINSWKARPVKNLRFFVRCLALEA